MAIDSNTASVKRARENNKKITKAILIGIKEYYEERITFLVKRAKANTPVKTGNLQRKIKAKEVKISSGKIETGIITDGVDYAITVHERPNTKFQGSTPEGGVGSKFVERVMLMHESQPEKHTIAEKMRKIGIEMKKK